MKILIIEDDQSVAELERDYLEINGGFQCDLYTDGTQGLQAALAGDYALVIVDVMLPGLSGFEICRRLREVKDTPVIIISALADDIDKVRGLGLGADDYMTKPFNPMELIARVKSQLRRYTNFGVSEEGGASSVTVNGGLEMDDGAKRVTVDGQEVALTPVEYKIVKFLMENRGLVFSSAQIYENVWNEPSYGADNIVAVHIRHIREKIEINPKEPRYIKVIWGHGYKMEKL